jgi:hypothetical protein
MCSNAFNKYLSENSQTSLYLIKLLSKRLANTNTKLKEVENEKTAIILNELSELFPDFSIKELDENLDKYLVENDYIASTGAAKKIILVDRSKKDILYKLYSTIFNDEAKNNLIKSASCYYLVNDMPEFAVRLLAQENHWEEVFDITNKFLENNNLHEKLIAEIVSCIKNCPDEIFASNNNVLLFLLNMYLDYDTEFGFIKIECILQNINAFTSEEKAELYTLAAKYCKKMGLKQKSLEYLNMAVGIADKINSSDSKHLIAEDEERKYELTERNYKSTFGMSMAKNARNHLFRKNRIPGIIAIFVSILLIGYFKYTVPITGLSRNAMIFIGISLAAVTFWIANIIPSFVVALLMALGWIMSGVVKPEVLCLDFLLPFGYIWSAYLLSELP